MPGGVSPPRSGFLVGGLGLARRLAGGPSCGLASWLPYTPARGLARGVVGRLACGLPGWFPGWLACGLVRGLTGWFRGSSLGGLWGGLGCELEGGLASRPMRWRRANWDDFSLGELVNKRGRRGAAGGAAEQGVALQREPGRGANGHGVCGAMAELTVLIICEHAKVVAEVAACKADVISS